MVIFCACDGISNVVHMIFGPQTGFQFDLLGKCELNLDDFIESFPDPTLPFKLIVTRSDDEHRTMEDIINYGEGKELPEYTDGEMESGTFDLDETKATSAEFPNINKGDIRGTFAREIICPLCKGKGVFLKSGTVPICGSCLEIEKGLGNLDNE